VSRPRFESRISRIKVLQLYYYTNLASPIIIIIITTIIIISMSLVGTERERATFTGFAYRATHFNPEIKIYDRASFPI
jgi:ABC-type transport system involved in cytochrome bd biosynthesis fused ATPase/permease subunit